MQQILTIIFICAVGPSTGTRYEGCPSGHTQIMMNCIAPIQRLQTHPSQNVRQMCSTMNTGLDCLQDIMESCPDQQDAATMASMMNIDQMRSLISSQCSGGPAPTFQPASNSNCPSGYTQRIMECVGPMQNIGPVTGHNIDQACGVVISGLTCLDNILENCAGEPEVQAMSSMLNMDTMRDMVQTQCVETNIVVDETNEVENQEELPNDNEIPEEPSCPDDYMAPLTRCMGGLNQLFGNINGNDYASIYQCQEIYANLDCATNLFSACSYIPEVFQVSTAFDEDIISRYIAAKCGPRVTPNGCDVSNPADELLICNGFLTSFQRDSMLSGCRALVEGFHCFRNLIRNCPNEPAVVAFTSMVDIETARESMSAYCPEEVMRSLHM